MPRSVGGGLRGLAGRERREISLNDSSIRDLTWALIISWALLEISTSNKWQIWQASAQYPQPPPLTPFIFTVIKDPFFWWVPCLSAHNESGGDCLIVSQSEKGVFHGTHTKYSICRSRETKSECGGLFYSVTSFLFPSRWIWTAA